MKKKQFYDEREHLIEKYTKEVMELQQTIKILKESLKNE
jgi:hypothetical protein